ncbi:MAG: alginate export family protein [Phycisphaerales bacterium]|nr:alginate export family protein [Phycisphaerales bacterium]NNM25271.1 alginate export family protein [Phycisphaerales bacterium]
MAAFAFVAPVAAQPTDSNFIRSIQRRLEQLDATYRLTVPPDQPISERLLIDYGGSLRFGFVTSDDRAGATRILRQSDATLHLRMELDGAHRFLGRLRFRYDDFNSGRSFDGLGDEFQAPIGDRYWYQFDLRGAELARTGQHLDWNLNVKAGRQYVHWNSGLALSNVLYSGIVEAEAGDLGLVGLVGVTPRTETIDFDATRPNYDTAVDKRFYGGRLEYRGLAQHRPSFSVLVQRDHNDADQRVFATPIGDVTTRFRYDSEYFTLGSRGSLGPSWLYRAEINYQSGRGLSSPINPSDGFADTQSESDIDAWAGILTLTHLFYDERETRLELELAAGSGDADRGHPSNTLLGNRDGTDDHAFNGLGYLNTGLALSPAISNLIMARGGVRTTLVDNRRRAGHLQMSFDAFLLNKVDAASVISVPTRGNRFVGLEFDLGLEWRLANDVSVDLRYGIFLPGNAIPRAQRDPRHFLYLGVLYAF